MPLNTRAAGVQWQNQVTGAGCKLLFCDNEFEAAGRSLGIPTAKLATAGQDTVPSRGVEFIGASNPEAEVSEVCIVHTSGSRSGGRGVILRQRNIKASALAVNEALQFTRNDTWGLVLPLFHVGGLSIIFRALFAEAGIVVLPTFDVTKLNSIINQALISHLSLVPTMLSELLSERNGQPFPNTLKCIQVSGAHCPGRLLEQSLALQAPLVISYGMTELSSTAVCTRIGQKLTAGMVGKPLRGVEVEIVPEASVPGRDNKAAHQTLHGIVAVRGDIVASDCLGAPTTTAQNVGDGWFLTGDLGRFDEDGNLILFGRNDDVIISGGENVHLADIEAAASCYPGLVSAAAIGVSDSKWGERPILIAQPASSTSFDAENLRQFLAAELGRYQLPDKIVLVEKMPLTETGKIDYAKLRQMIGDQSGAD